jgi:hypothetical protein
MWRDIYVAQTYGYRELKFRMKFQKFRVSNGSKSDQRIGIKM